MYRELDGLSDTESDLSDTETGHYPDRKEKKKRLSKWARLSLTNVRDLASKESTPKDVGESLSSTELSDKARAHHKRSLSFLGRKKVAESSSSSDESSYASLS